MFRSIGRFFQRRASSTKNAVLRTVNYSEWKENGQWIGRMGRAIRDSGKRKGREESFQNAYLRLGLTEAKLGQAHRYQIFRFYLFLAGTAIGSGVGVYTAVAGQWMQAAPWIGFLSVCLAMVCSASFRLYQIERRELVGVAEWARAPGSWIPAPFQPASPTRSAPKTAGVTALPHRRPSSR